MKNNTKSLNYTVALMPVLFGFFVMGFVDILGVATSYVKQDFSLSDTWANFLPLTTLIWFLFLSLPIGILTNRIGRKNTVLLSFLVTTASMGVPLLFYSFGSILFAFALLGIGNTILQVSLSPLVTNLIPSKRLTSTLTLGQFIKSISSTLAPILIGVAATRFGDWKYVFIAYASLTLFSFIWLISVSVPKEKTSRKQNSREIIALLKDKYLMILFLVIVLIVGYEIGLITAIPKYLTEKFGLSLIDGGEACSLYFIAKMAGTFAGAFLLAFISPKKFLTGTMILAVVCMGGFLWSGTPWGARISLFLLGLFTANVFSIALSKAMQYKPEQSNEISALMIMGVTGGAILPPLMGVVADHSNQGVSLIIPWTALGIVLLISIFVVKE